VDETPWWRTAVVYQIYPRSFAPSRAHPDGRVGDLRGIVEHLDHLEWLGVDAVWLSPVFRSPMADFGYDVSDFCDIDPTFGTLADMDELIAALHDRGMKLLLDWVPNHTSIEHPWFESSRRDPDGPHGDWYVWRDEPANNWLASFPKGDPAWHLDPVRGQYYLRSFAPEQADLDWDVPAVEAAMHDTLRFWLDRGVDGFRMDVVHLLGKDLADDDPPEVLEQLSSHVPRNDVPVTHERLRRIRAVLDEYPGDRTSVGEVYLLDESAIARYYGDGDELHMSFNFAFLWARPTVPSFRRRIASTLEHLRPVDAWPTWALSNHDVVRHRQRHGGDEQLARMTAVMLLTLPGTPFLYQGEELGLLDADVPPERRVDPGERDGCRAPVPWDATPGHGWAVDPWLPFPPEADRRNVAAMRDDPASIAHLYRDLLALRRAEGELQLGELSFVELRAERGPEDAADALAYRRGDGWLVVINLGDDPVALGEEVTVAVTSREGAARAGSTTAVVEGRTALVARRP